MPSTAQGGWLRRRPGQLLGLDRPAHRTYRHSFSVWRPIGDAFSGQCHSTGKPELVRSTIIAVSVTPAGITAAFIADIAGLPVLIATGFMFIAILAFTAWVIGDDQRTTRLTTLITAIRSKQPGSTDQRKP